MVDLLFYLFPAIAELASRPTLDLAEDALIIAAILLMCLEGAKQRGKMTAKERAEEDEGWL